MGVLWGLQPGRAGRSLLGRCGNGENNDVSVPPHNTTVGSQAIDRSWRKDSRQYDLPSLEEVSQLVAKLSHSGLPKLGGAGRRGQRTMEERFPTELGALRVEFDRHAEGDGQGMTAKDAVEWMTRRGGYASAGALPAGGLTEEQVKRVVSRWRKQPAAAVRSVEDGSDDDDDARAGLGVSVPSVPGAWASRSTRAAR